MQLDPTSVSNPNIGFGCHPSDLRSRIDSELFLNGLLLIDTGKRDVKTKSMKLVAGRSGQEYNQRKDRRGAKTNGRAVSR